MFTDPLTLIFVSYQNPILFVIVYERLKDSELAALLKQGDENAFQLLYNRYWSRMYGVASKRLNDPAEAEELVQDIFLGLWRRRQTFELRTGFDQYLAVAVKFEVISRRAKRVKEQAAIRQLSTHAQTHGRAAVQVDMADLWRQLEQTISSLPPKCRLVFKLSRQNDYSNKETAAALNISEKAVEKHITYALKILRTRFGSHYSAVLCLLASIDLST